MLRVGSTITLEAWDDKFKPNQDWNHAWGAVPGNIIPRYLMGVRPLQAGFAKILIQPQPASLEKATAAIPTIRGTVSVSFDNKPKGPFTLKVELPANMTARIGLPAGIIKTKTLTLDGKKVQAQRKDGYLFIDEIGSGSHTLSN
jgi:alpha-L-rhamnosidase